MRHQVSTSEIYNNFLDSGIETSPVRELCLEQALEIFVGQTFNVGDFMDELLSEGDWSQEDKGVIRAAISHYDGAKVFSIRPSLSEQIQSASARTAEVDSTDKLPAKESTPER